MSAMFSAVDRVVIAAGGAVIVLLIAVMWALGFADQVNTWQHPNDPSVRNYVQPTGTDPLSFLREHDGLGV